MAPPLLPSVRMSPCPTCSEHVKISEGTCPHCGTVLRIGNYSLAAAVVLGLAVSACTVSEPEYGVPTSADTEGMSSTSGMSSGDDSTGDSTGETSTETVGEPEYGVPTTDASESESDYGVPTTDTNTESESASESDTNPEPRYGGGAA